MHVLQLAQVFSSLILAMASFAVGTAGLGKRTMVKRLLQQHAKNMPTPNDWVYVYNFKSPRQPIALELPAGQAVKFQTMLHQTWQTTLKQLERRFTAETYPGSYRSHSPTSGGVQPTSLD